MIGIFSDAGRKVHTQTQLKETIDENNILMIFTPESL